MKCDKCFFCTHIGKGIYADYPVKYCKYHKVYLRPFVMSEDGGIKRQLDFRRKGDQVEMMTIQETIERLKVIQSSINWDMLSEDYSTAIDEAIYALRKRETGLKMLEVEEMKENRYFSSIFVNDPNPFLRGRISGMHDALGLDYSD